MKRILLSVVLLLILAAGGVFYFKRDDIAMRIFRQGVERNLGRDTAAALPDGLTAAFCGTGSPLPDRQRAGPCTAVIADGRLFVFDAGDGATETLALMGLSPGKIEAVFLTHFHSDHIDGLGGVALQHWGTGAARAPLPVYGAEGVERVAAGFNEAYALDSGYRVAHHGPQVVPPEGFGLAPHAFTIPEGQESVVVLDDGGVKIIAFRVDHGPVHPAVGYRIEYKGRSIVISGDTSPTPMLVRASQNADLMIVEGLSTRMVGEAEAIARAKGEEGIAHIFHDIPDYHTDPQEAARMASEAHAGALALTHVIPPLPLAIMEGPYLGDARSRYSGPLWIMKDGDMIVLPAAGGIERRRAL
ncbi:MBL fold metallo-hydrolase [Terricaulis sp.]|uniref:MBL fold metallo-hydrolase n=1 Tax=Terricaulis sp. TaxID=2768686 RepID=UPI0037847F63